MALKTYLHENRKLKYAMKTKLLLAAGVIVLFFTACTDELFLHGNGIPVSEARLVPAFSSVSSEGNFEVHVTQGDVSEVLVHGESNLLPYIETDVRGNNLRIRLQGMHILKNRLPVEVFVTVPYIEKLVQSGSGVITTGKFNGESIMYVVSGSGAIETSAEAKAVDAVVSGSGYLYLTGAAQDARMTMSGSGKIGAWNFSVRNCDAQITGSGDIWIDVDYYLKAVISGSGNVFYSGTPRIEMVVSGSGGVIHKN